MGLTFFESNEDNGTGELLFLNDWLKENPKNKDKQFILWELKAVKSGKGFIGVTNSFQIFFWKNSKLAKMLVEAMNVWINLEPDTGYELVVVLDPKSKDGYRIAADKDKKVTWFQMGNGYTTSEGNAFSEETDLNPFL